MIAVAVGDVVMVTYEFGEEIVYLLLGRAAAAGKQPRWECLVLHCEDDVWSYVRPGCVVRSTEDNLQQGEKLS